jgi:hypothetical protein
MTCKGPLGDFRNKIGHFQKSVVNHAFCVVTRRECVEAATGMKFRPHKRKSLLITAYLEEAKRRGRLPSSRQTHTRRESVPKPSASTGKSLSGRQAETVTISLTRGQVNAVR